MRYRLIVDHYGKIEHAEVTVAPLTLFVGDNNSGKSYLLSLLWALDRIRNNSPLFDGLQNLDMPQCQDLLKRLVNLMNEVTGEIEIDSEILVHIFNVLLEKNKQKLIDDIFNYRGGNRIEHIHIQLLEHVSVTVKFELSEGESGRLRKSARIYFGGWEEPSGRLLSSAREAEDLFVMRLLKAMLRELIKSHKGSKVCLPTARTGFILAKDVINRMGRQATYDWMQGSEVLKPQPFTKPIIEFLNDLEDIYVEAEVDSKRMELVQWLEGHMIQGRLQYVDDVAKEIQYVPQGTDRGIPLRTSSAVVTELTPLFLFLKYEEWLDMIYYEEPEMCLHPQLQSEMGRLLIRMVNSGISVVATTHSDIILQHVNNMIKAFDYRNDMDFLQEAELETIDCLNINDVAIYQFTNYGDKSIVKELKPGNDGFEIPTFTEALMDLLDKTTVIQEYES